MKIFKSENELITLLKWDNLRLEQAIARVRELHYEDDGLCGWCLDLDESNGKWYRPKYPCHTIKALDGEQ